jgi:hypothetical protein
LFSGSNLRGSAALLHVQIISYRRVVELVYEAQIALMRYEQDPSPRLAAQGDDESGTLSSDLSKVMLDFAKVERVLELVAPPAVLAAATRIGLALSQEVATRVEAVQISRPAPAYSGPTLERTADLAAARSDFVASVRAALGIEAA